MVVGTDQPEAGAAAPHRPRVVFFTPAEVTVMLARDLCAPPLPGRDAEEEERARARADANEAVLGMIAAANEALAQHFPDRPKIAVAQERFARVGRRPDRAPLFFDDGRQAFVLQTVNLAGWRSDPENGEGAMLLALEAVRDAVGALNDMHKRQALAVGDYAFVAASPTWLPMPFQNGDG